MDFSLDEYVLAVRIDPSTASTRIVALDNEAVTNGRRCYIEKFKIHYDGDTPWTGDATEIYIESTSALGGDRFATIPIASLAVDRETNETSEGVIQTPLMFASEGGVASLGVSVICDDDAASGSDIIITMWIRVSTTPATDTPSSASDKTMTSPQTVQSDLSVAAHTYELWRFGKDFFGDNTNGGLHSGFTGHSKTTSILLPCNAGDELQSITLHYEQTAGSGTTADVSLIRINVDDGTTAQTDTATDTLEDTAGVHATTINTATLTAPAAGECYAVKIETDNNGNSDWTLRAIKAVFESTKVTYDTVAA